MRRDKLTIFGGEKGWSSADWTDSDDRVRGGNSRSFMECSVLEPCARFHGELDIKTLGGAGFASQRTTGVGRSWDLSDYDGIEIEVSDADAKQYTFVIKDTILPRNPDTGREQSTISYEYEFRLNENENDSRSSNFIFIPWSSFKATYRGKEKKGASPLNTKNIKRFSFMMRSFFGQQEGSFSLYIKQVLAVGGTKSMASSRICSEKEDLEDQKYIVRENILEEETRARYFMRVFAMAIIICGFSVFFFKHQIFECWNFWA